MKLRAGAVSTAALAALVGLVSLGPAMPRRAGAEGITTEQAQAILNELRQIRQLLERAQSSAAPRVLPVRPTDARVQVTLGEGYALGSPDAPLTLVEFTDYACPFCRQFHLSTFEELKRSYVDTGKLRYVSRDLPLDIHPHAMRAALAARCAGDQGRFWELRHALFASGGRLDEPAMRVLGHELGLDLPRFEACVTGEQHRQAVQRDVDDARLAGAAGTPTFVLGTTTKDGVDGIRLVGALPFGTFDAKLKELLARQP